MIVAGCSDTTFMMCDVRGKIMRLMLGDAAGWRDCTLIMLCDVAGCSGCTLIMLCDAAGCSDCTLIMLCDDAVTVR